MEKVFSQHKDGKFGTNVRIGTHSMLVLMWWVFAVFQLYRSSVLFETIRHETQLSTDYKLSLFDLQTSSYQALQRVLVSLGDLTLLSLGVFFPFFLSFLGV